jgi:hypothetical protein
MEICSPFDDPVFYDQLDNGCLFYALHPGSRSLVLAMRVENVGASGTQPGCLLFDPTITLRLELDNNVVVPLPKATLVLGDDLGNFPSEYPKHGELVQTRGGPYLMLITAPPGVGVVPDDARRAVEMRTGKVGKAPRYPDEFMLPFREWKIVLPSPTEPEKWKPIYKWPPRKPIYAIAKIFKP